ncbi:MAG: CocE/NonD family hydrolase [Gemmatimonadetes bacterium]|nr:CocE/NonD family hydrolase [Gemmatimonadota bacterium]MBT7595708.1 CocE/NonD family hydrolase [Gemmatimonadota bacterium]
MRDGVELFTLVMIPHDVSKPMPIVLTRTPYSAARRASRTTSPDIAMALPAADEALVRDGYIRVYQDVRGRFGSKGRYTMTMPTRGPFNEGKVDQVTDAWDTVEWLVSNVEGNSSRVGITGTSYDGLLTLMSLLDPHPALKAAVPVNAMVDSWLGDDFYRHGAFRTVMLEYVYRQTASRNAAQGIPWGYHDFYSAVLEAGSIGELGRQYGADKLPAWNRLLEHPAYDDYWQDQALHKLLEKAPRRVPVLTVHSLFDQEDLYGPVLSHETLARRDRSGNKTHLAIGPWCHGQQSGEGSELGALKWGSDTSLEFRRQMLLPFWAHHLKREKPSEPLPKVLAFETGANRWRQYDSWPPTDQTKSAHLYLHEEGCLSFDRPKKATESFTEYISDPAKPVPYRVRPIVPSFGGQGSTWRRWLVDDQRPFADRTDVITFVSPFLEKTVTVSGEITATLFASTTGTDADWVVKFIDLYPNEVPAEPSMGGYQFMISGDILRGRYRQSFEEAVPIEPGEVLPYTVIMPHVHHTFEVGHRIMIQIQSSWFPLCDRNPQTFVEQIAWAQPADFQKATHRIHHTTDSASFVELPLQAADAQSAATRKSRAHSRSSARPRGSHETSRGS